MSKFLDDLKEVYRLSSAQQEELQNFYKVLQKQSLFDSKLTEYEALLEEFLAFLGLSYTQRNVMAAVQRIVNLREDMLLQVIEDLDEDEKIALRQKAYVWVSRLYEERFEKLLEEIKKRELLTPFYRTLLRYAHKLGKVFTLWQPKWMDTIIYGINRELLHLFNGDEEKIYAMLYEKGLFDRGHQGEIADRSYSVLVKSGEEFARVAYAKAFEEEVRALAQWIDEAIGALEKLEDEEYGLKGQWIGYFRALKEALLQKDPDKTLQAWAHVDRIWMQIDTPIQIGHPLEYYEDKFRRAVALEWDVRIINPDYEQGKRTALMKLFFEKMYQKIGIKKDSIYTQTLQNLDRVQLYVGRALFFYGSEFNGLFSAQVVPNDEVVSQEMGKKIFAFADMVLQMHKARPKMRLSYEVFGKELADRIYSLKDNEQVWYTIYDITTIGHEYGHILWMDSDSERLMNRSGMFKLAEEFKATSGALMCYFLLEGNRYWEELLLDHLQRSVSLIGWMEVEEVEPYYVEGLLHLYGFFEAGILVFDERLVVDLSYEKVQRLQKWYEKTYTDLVSCYLLKEDIKKFLDKFIKRKHKVFMPKNRQIQKFVDYYYRLYKQMGTEIIKE